MSAAIKTFRPPKIKPLSRWRIWLLRFLAGDYAVAINIDIIHGEVRLEGGRGLKSGLMANCHIENTP